MAQIFVSFIFQILARISNDFTFEDAHLELATDKRMDAVIKFVNEEFAPDETISKSLEFVQDEEVEQIIRHTFRENLSVLLISNSTDEIIAVRLSHTTEKEGNSELKKKVKNKKFVTMLTFLTHKDEESNPFDKYGVDKAVYFVMLGVDRRYRRRGIGTKIMDAAIKFYSEIGIEPVVIKGEGTSNFSKRIYEKFGFETLHEFPYEDYKIDGEIVFNNTGEHKSCKIFAKIIPPK